MASLVLSGKTLFVGLMAGSLTGLAGLMVVIGYISGYGLHVYQKLIFTAGVLLFSFVFLLAAFGVGGLALMLWRGWSFPVMDRVANMAINLMLPLTLQFGRFLGISANTIKGSFIEVNNQLLSYKKIRVKPEEALVLAPHCLQYSSCPYKITRDIRHCKGCGRCQVGDFIRLQDTVGVNVSIVTGGTLARERIREYRPNFVLAIACERDLTSGILESYPLPVFGLLNQRPNGPCRDTRVEMNRVHEELTKFIY